MAGAKSRALVLGVNGQDGTLLARNLLRRGYAVIGVGRQPAPRHVVAQDGFTYAATDIADPAAVTEVLERHRPDAVFHVAAEHGSSGFIYETVWQSAMRVNLGSVHTVLEYARARQPDLRLVYASSCKVFGATPPPEVSEESPKLTTCLYSLTKNAALEMIELYRRAHGTRAAVLFLFNHESELRAPQYFFPRLVSALAAAVQGKTDGIEVATLNFRCDWGWADEYMDIAIDVAEKACDTDFVLATGRTWTGREFTKALFAHHGLDYRGVIHERLTDVEMPPDFSALPRKLERLIGRRPMRPILELGETMLAWRRAGAESR